MHTFSKWIFVKANATTFAGIWTGRIFFGTQSYFSLYTPKTYFVIKRKKCLNQTHTYLIGGENIKFLKVDLIFKLKVWNIVKPDLTSLIAKPSHSVTSLKQVSWTRRESTVIWECSVLDALCQISFNPKISILSKKKSNYTERETNPIMRTLKKTNWGVGVCEEGRSSWLRTYKSSHIYNYTE